MTWPGVTFRTELPEVVRKELERFSAALRAHLAAEGVGGVTNTDPLQPVPGGAYDLDYLGDYGARVYNDGDIVIGPDGIAYVCVKDGVTTPPEPWPGVGIASSQGPPGPMGPTGPPGPAGTEVLDATYWIASAHAKLLAARNIGALANGYVKHTAGNPYTVAVIPIAEGGTAGTTAAEARTNLGLGTMAVQNANAVAITGGSIVAGAITSTGGINAAGDITSGNGIGAVFFAGDGSNITNLNANLLTHGRVATVLLGTGVADANTFLRGDQTWAPASGIPRGLIAMFSTACPVGWTRVSALDGRFPMGGTGFGGAGGSSTHSHAASGSTGGSGTHRHYMALNRPFSGTTDQANVTTPVAVNRQNGLDLLLFLPHAHGFSGNVLVEGDTAEAGDHTHPVSIGTDARDHTPPYLTVVYCQKD